MARTITTTRTLHITSVVSQILNITLVLTSSLTSALVSTHTNILLTITIHVAITFTIIRTLLLLLHNDQVVNRHVTSCIPMCLNVSDDRTLNITITATS